VSLPDRLLLVLEPTQARRDLLEDLAAAGARWFWLRAKTLSASETELLLWRLLPLPPGVTLSLGGHPALAATLGLGCHLPRDGDVAAAARLGLPLLGCSAHDAGEAERAFAAGAGYVTLSPLFQPLSKVAAGPALGLERFTAIARRLPRPVLALGGVTPERVGACLAAGAAGVAVAGGILGAPDPGAALRRFRAGLAA
jgi:thiamine-phosphate pyrophosphorylase